MVEIVGFKRMAGTSKKTGKPYSGYTVWYLEEQRNVTGHVSDSTFIPDDLLCGSIPEIGQLVDLIYNKSGYLVDAKFI